MTELKTRRLTETAMETSGYGPFQVDLSLAKEAYILAQARRLQAQFWASLWRRVRSALIHPVDGAFADTARFMQTHKVLHGGSH